MPILTVTLGLQYYDKAVLGNAAVFGILTSLDLQTKVNGVVSTARYSTATAAFYYGYIVAVLPMALLFARLPLAKTAAVLVLLWGLTCLLTVVCHNYPGFVTQRVFLGLMESAVSPAFVAITALWYKPQEQATRMGIWYSATGIFSMVSGLINFGLGHAKLAEPWKAMYYFCGSVTMAWSLIIWFFLPESPLDPGRFFSEEEKAILLRRFEESPYGRDRQTLKGSQAVEALTDIKTYILLLTSAAIYICNGSVTAFGAKIIAGFGYSSLQSTALLIPGGAVTCVTIYIFAYFADRYRDIRTYLLPISCIPVVVGALVIWLAPWTPRAGPLIGYYLVASFGAPYVLLLTLAASNTAGATKKAITSGATFVGYNAGNISAAYLVIAKEKAIKYRTTWIAVIVGMVFASLASLVLRFLYARENRRRDQLGHVPVNSHGAAAGVGNAADEKALGHELPIIASLEAYQDLTDRQRPEFRYSL